MSRNITSSEYSYYLLVKVYKKISSWIIMGLSKTELSENSGNCNRQSCVAQHPILGRLNVLLVKLGLSNYPLLGASHRAHFYYEHTINPLYLKVLLIGDSPSCSYHTLIMKNMGQVNTKVRSLNFRMQNSTFPRS